MFTSRECNVYTFIYLHTMLVLLCLHPEDAIFTLLFTYTMRFCYVCITRVQFLHFYLRILWGFVMFTSRECNVYTLFTYTMGFCYVQILRVQCLHFYLHKMLVFVMFTIRECNFYTFIYTHSVVLLCLYHENAMFTLLFTNKNIFLYAYTTIFCYIYITIVQCLRFYFHTLSVFVLITSQT
jgi:hypothetical protein